MKDSVVVRLPYPHTLFGVTISTGKKIGFLFTNQSIFNFRENIGIADSSDYERWLKANGEPRLISEMMYAAAQAYYQKLVKRQPFTKSKLIQAIAAADVDTQQQIVDAWRRSQTFGAVESKKKTMTRRK